MFWRPIFLTNGLLLSVLGVTMLFPMCADLYVGNADWQVFALSAVITTFLGGILFLTNRGSQAVMKVRQAFLLTVTSYLSVSICAALPLWLSELRLDLPNAIFEATSGITATGATVLSGLDVMPPGILLWRSILNALGGIGIVVMALAILPLLRIGGMQLFRTESSDNSEKLLPRTPQIALSITTIFISLTILCGWCYWLAGMSAFDALCHALTTIATGGFSTHDASIGYYNSPLIEVIALIFMLSGAIPLMLYYQVASASSLAPLWRTSQVRFFLAIIMLVASILALWLVMQRDIPLFEALRQGLFATVTIITTTGYATQDYGSWGSLPVSLLFMLIVVGGCTGSTSGGIKIFRYQILYETARAQLRQLIQPHGVFVARYDGKPVSEGLIASVMTFLLLFAFCFMVLSVMLSAFGLDFLTSMSAAAQALANVGPGLGDVIGPAGNYASLPDGAKWLLSAAMIMGRLELFTVIVLFTPAFWLR